MAKGAPQVSGHPKHQPATSLPNPAVGPSKATISFDGSVLQRGMFFPDVEHRLATTLIGDCNVFRINLADKDRISSKIAPLAFCTSGFLSQSS